MSKNICSMCSGTGISMNYQKRVDPPVQQYGTILGDAPQQGDFPRGSRGAGCGGSGAGASCMGMCVSSCPPSRPSGPSTLIQVPQDPPTDCPRFVCEPCAPPPPTKIWLIKSSPVPQKVNYPEELREVGCLVFSKSNILFQSFCLPIGAPFCEESSPSGSCGSFVFCFPPQPPVEKPKPKRKEEELKPIGYISRNKDVDFIGGKLIGGCLCGRKNGLSGDCPRISCRNNPGCNMNPPRCWPQFKEPEPPPPPPPDQQMICVPIQLVYCDPPSPPTRPLPR